VVAMAPTSHRWLGQREEVAVWRWLRAGLRRQREAAEVEVVVGLMLGLRLDFSARAPSLYRGQ
jgi:hypothetical protein